MKPAAPSRRRILSLLPATALSSLGTTSVLAPRTSRADNKPIEWVVGYAPGGGSDAVARMLAETMGKAMGRSLIVNNRPGAGSNIAAEAVARSRNAEHTLFTADSAVLAANPFLYRKLTYNVEKDFAPIGMIARFPLVLVVGPGAPPTNYQTFVEWVRSDPKGAPSASPAFSASRACPTSRPSMSRASRASRPMPGRRWSPPWPSRPRPSSH